MKLIYEKEVFFKWRLMSLSNIVCVDHQKLLHREIVLNFMFIV